MAVDRLWDVHSGSIAPIRLKCKVPIFHWVGAMPSDAAKALQRRMNYRARLNNWQPGVQSTVVFPARLLSMRLRSVVSAQPLRIAVRSDWLSKQTFGQDLPSRLAFSLANAVAPLDAVEMLQMPASRRSVSTGVDLSCPVCTLRPLFWQRSSCSMRECVAQSLSIRHRK